MRCGAGIRQFARRRRAQSGDDRTLRSSGLLTKRPALAPASSRLFAYLRLDREVPEQVLSLCDQRAAVATMAVNVAWQLCSSHYFSHPAHINMYEGEAFVSVAERLARQGLRRSRVVILLDSAVLLGAASEGRSSAKRLKHVLRRLASWALEANLSFELARPQTNIVCACVYDHLGQ